ncbi:hypothetical protein SCA6_006642 [Theobroma cacao]
MHLYECKRTVKSFNAALKVLIQTTIEAFLTDIPQKFNTFCEMDFLERAYLVMVEMEKLGIRLDVITYTTLISAFYQKREKIGDWQ